jgi:peptide/nickel transport system permease protein
MSEANAAAASAPGRAPSPALRLLRHVGGLPAATVVGAVTLTIILLMVLAAPYLASTDPMQLSGNMLLAPGLDFPMGTDDLGRDVFARVLFGGQVSLFVGVTSALIAVALGLTVGVLAGYSGGIVDEILMRITEIFQILPRLLVAIVVVAMVGAGLVNVIVVIGLLSWPPTARIVRSQVMIIRKEEFILAAILSGSSYLRVIVRQILPNIGAFLLVSASMQVSSAILTEAALSFLGLGDPSIPTWGQMLQQSQSYLRQAWWMSVFPGAMLALTILSLNLLGDGFGSRLPRSAR